MPWLFQVELCPENITDGENLINSLFCLPFNYYYASLENLVLDQLSLLQLTIFFILITYLLDIVLILLGEILPWSLMGVKRLKEKSGK